MNQTHNFINKTKLYNSHQNRWIKNPKGIFFKNCDYKKNAVLPALFGSVINNHFIN